MENGHPNELTDETRSQLGNNLRPLISDVMSFPVQNASLPKPCENLLSLHAITQGNPASNLKHPSLWTSSRICKEYNPLLIAV